MGNQVKCEMCCYYYKDRNDKHSCCHYKQLTPWDLAPCEVDDYEPADETPDIEEIEEE